MGFSVVEAANARCMRRNRGELRLLARTAAFFVVPEDLLCALAGFDGGPAVARVLSEACANNGADEPARAVQHSAKTMNLENPATFL